MLFFLAFFLILNFFVSAQVGTIKYLWTVLSTEYGDLEMPGKGTVQTYCVLGDFTNNGKDGFVIIEKLNLWLYCYVFIQGKENV
jgi:hypothetical protein